MIYWNGCSFVRGMEVGKKKHKFAWSVSEEFNQECINHAKVGGSNDRIWRTTINDVPQFFQPALVVIMWTGINRMEYLEWAPLSSHEFIWRAANWANFNWNPKTGVIDKENSYITRNPVPGVVKKSLQDYMVNVRNMPFNLIYNLHYMYTTNIYLKSLGINVLNYTMSNTPYLHLPEYLERTFREGANFVWETPQIDKKEWFKRLPFLKEEGMYDMCKKAGVPFGEKDHPLEQGHALMHDRIVKDIRKHGFNKEFN